VAGLIGQLDDPITHYERALCSKQTLKIKGQNRAGEGGKECRPEIHQSIEIIGVLIYFLVGCLIGCWLLVGKGIVD
jgi:hypothetical protein